MLPCIYFTPEVIKKNKGYSSLAALWLNVIKNNIKKFVISVFLVFFVSLMVSNASLSLRNFINQVNICEEVRIRRENAFNSRGFEFSFIFFKINLFEKKNLTFFQFFAYFMVILIIPKSLIGSFSYFLQIYWSSHIEKELKKDLMNLFLYSKYSDSLKFSKNLQTHIASNISWISEGLWKFPLRMIQIIFGVCFFALNDLFDQENTGGFSVFLIYICFFIFLFLISLFLFSLSNKYQSLSFTKLADANKRLFEVINNLEFIKLNSSEDEEKKRINILLEDFYKSHKKTIFFSSLYRASSNWVIGTNIPYFTIMVAAVFEKLNYVSHTIKLGVTLQSIININSNLLKIIEQLMEFDELSGTMVSLGNDISFVKKKEIIEQKKNTFIFGDLLFKNVWFSYPGSERFIMRDFSFSFRKGKIYGIAGKNGVGKSTIVKTLLNIYEINKGDIFIGENNIEDLDIKSFRRQVCIQTNRPAFMNKTIAENIYYPEQCPINYGEILENISEKVGITNFISKLPLGFDTILNINSLASPLSEGEKQQIFSMKIFVRDYSVYIFDEILGNIKRDLRKKILENIFKKVREDLATVIIIDHQADVFEYADEVFEFFGDSLLSI